MSDTRKLLLFSELPDDVTNEILKYFGYSDLAIAKRVSPIWKTTIDQIINKQIEPLRKEFITAINNKDQDKVGQVIQDAIDHKYLPLLWESPSKSDFNQNLAKIIIQLIGHADLSIKSLIMSSLQNADLSKCEFGSISANKINMQGANLEHAKFGVNELSGRQPKTVELKNANFKNANLNNVEIGEGGNLTNAILEGATLTNVKAIDINLNHANLTNANLLNAKLGMPTVSNANLTGANLVGVEFSSNPYFHDYIVKDLISAASLRDIKIDKETLLANKFDGDDIKKLKEKIVKDSIAFIQSNSNIDEIAKMIANIITLNNHPLKIKRDAFFFDYGNTDSSIEVIQAGRQKLLLLLNKQTNSGSLRLSDETKENLKLIATADIYNVSTTFSNFFSPKNSVDEELLTLVMGLTKSPGPTKTSS